MQPAHFDVIVVGAGPAGALTAYELGRRGLRTVLLEKHRLPREKTCGGGLTHKVLDVVPFDLAPVIERTITTVALSWRLKGASILKSANPLIHFIRRHRFDAFLVEQAVSTGHVELVDGTGVSRIDAGDDEAVVQTPSGAFAARYVVGADGANGIVARSFGLLSGRVLLPAVECEFAVDSATMDAWTDRVGIDVGTLPGGYGWVFPKGEHLNVGVGCFAPSTGSNRLVAQYERDHFKYWLPKATMSSRRGAVLPLRPPGAPIQQRRILLVGDAAGLVEAFTGEGIYWALRSGKLAARSIAEALAPGAPSLRYQDAVDRELMPDLVEARRLAHLYLWWPGCVHTLPTRWPAAWRTVQNLVRGERRFTDIRGLLGMPGRLIGLIPTGL
ncbi:MAG TPA: geranylgeranyl reductase family protein [Burkholderiaceae bacterium]|nr:geranylgeranyl reductase family protein [Burkholderiaceae bacterium]